jgi:hypothetical protein
MENADYLMASGIGEAFRGATTNLVRWLVKKYGLNAAEVSPWSRHRWCTTWRRRRIQAAAALRIAELDTARQAYQSAVRKWIDRLQVEESSFPEGPIGQQPFSTLFSRWTAQGSRTEELHSLVAFNQISAECQRERLGNIASIAASWEPAGKLLVPLYERIRLSSLLERAFRERPSLANFDGVRQANTVEEFRRLDLLQLEYNRALLAAKHAASLPSGGGAGEIGVLWREFDKRGSSSAWATAVRQRVAWP